MSKMQSKSILEMARGAFLERADYEMSKILDNINDVNTKPTKKRTLTITVEFTPDEDRRNIIVNTVVKSKLEPTNAIRTSLYVTEDEQGEALIAEMTPQVPGQLGLDGTEQEKPAILKLIKGA